MKLAILLLCHESPAHIVKLLSSRYFLHPDICVYVHYDAKRSESELEEIRGKLPKGIRAVFLAKRVNCQWGEYSLVDATHRLMKLALADTEFSPDYLALLSGSCVPIRPFSSLQEFLRRRRGIDFIQTHDISQGRWIKDGLEIERCWYYFPFNFITKRFWFDRFTTIQRKLGVRRKIPSGLRIHFGSQWFCLTRKTAGHVATQLDKPRLKKFFSHSWIPDEFAIQTLVGGVQKGALKANHNLTYYEFDPQGCPLVLNNEHFAHLLKQPFFFARKIAPEAQHLSAQLEAYISSPEYDLSYFDRVGVATIDYQKFLANVQQNKSTRARVGTVKDPWRGPMDVSSRRYYVLYSSSRAYLLELLANARATSGLPIFDLPFDPHALLLARERNIHYGFQASDKQRRDYDPAAFLLELVHAHPTHSSAFGLDPALSGWVRDFVRWDPNAVLVNCDRLDLTTEQKVGAILREVSNARDAQTLAQTLSAARNGTELPHDHFHTIWESKEYSCNFVALHAHGDNWNSPTLQALRSAAWHVDTTRWFPDQAAARSLIRV